MNPSEAVLVPVPFPATPSPVVRESQSAENYNPLGQAEGRRQAVAHPGEGGAGRDAEETRVDPREGRIADDALLRDQADSAREQPAHGV